MTANDRISWSVDPGKIHALIGENGAGKSTLMKVLFGLETPDDGRILWKGRPRPWRTPLEAKSHGVGMVHQHFMQAENLTALEHLSLELTAATVSSRLWMSPAGAGLVEQAEALSQQYGLPLPWARPVRELSVGEQQRLEILKALAHPSELLILDEPTAVLAPQEVAPFLDRLRQLKADGKTIILITHKLKEVLNVADTITVLRRGRLIWTGTREAETEESLAEKMIGERLPPIREHTSIPDVAAEWGLHLDIQDGHHFELKHRRLGRWHLHLRPGEILGVAGVDGNGQEELTELLVHPDQFEIQGTIRWQAADVPKDKDYDPRQAGLAWIPADRLNQAAIAEMNALENYVLGHATEHSARGKMRWNEARVELEADIEKFDIRPPETAKAFGTFSGGNQQKIVVAREFRGSPRLIVACHPTRGIDVLAARRIHEQLRDLRSQGAATLLISADIDELFALADRLIVLYRSEIQLELTRADFSSEKVGRAMAGLS